METLGYFCTVVLAVLILSFLSRSTRPVMVEFFGLGPLFSWVEQKTRSILACIAGAIGSFIHRIHAVNMERLDWVAAPQQSSQKGETRKAVSGLLIMIGLILGMLVVHVAGWLWQKVRELGPTCEVVIGFIPLPLWLIHAAVNDWKRKGVRWEN